MVALNFKSEFALPVANREKRQSIRRSRKDDRQHMQVGDRVQLYTGMRTRQCRKLSVVDPVCIFAGPVRLCAVGFWFYDVSVWSHNGPHHKSIYGSQDASKADFAHADGFDSFADMQRFFDIEPYDPSSPPKRGRQQQEFIGWLFIWDWPDDPYGLPKFLPPEIVTQWGVNRQEASVGAADPGM